MNNGTIMELENADLQVRISAAKELGEVGNTGAIEPLLGALKRSLESDIDPIAHFSVAAEIIRSLGKIGDIRAVEPLSNIVVGIAPFVKHINNFMRQAERKAFAEAVFSKPVASTLTQQTDNQMDRYGKLFDEIDYLRTIAAVALGKIKDPKAVFPLIFVASIENNKQNLRRNCHEALIEIGQSAVPGLIELLDNRVLAKDPSKDQVASAAAYILGELKSQKAVPSLVRAIDSKDNILREAAVQSLQEILISPRCNIDENEFGLLLNSLKRGNRFAAQVLGNIKDIRAVEPLIIAIGKWSTRDDAMNALVNIGQPAIEPLTNALKHKKRAIRKHAEKVLSRLK